MKNSLSLLLCLLLYCCAASQPIATPPHTTTQVIIKFWHSNTSANHKDTLKQLQHISGLSLNYVMPISGNAHIYQCQQTATTINQGIQKLNQADIIQYAEQNQSRHLFTSPD